MERVEIDAGDSWRWMHWEMLKYYDYRSLRIRHWWLMVIFPVAWYGFLAWRVRRGSAMEKGEW